MEKDTLILLLSKRFSGDITPEETSMLEAHLQQSEASRRLAAAMERIWSGSAAYGKTFTPDLDRDFSRVTARIAAQKTSPAPVFKTRRYWLRAAAAVALLMGGYWFYTLQTNPNNSQLAYSSKNGATFTTELPDGSRVWLHNDSKLSCLTDLKSGARNVRLEGEGYFEVKHDPQHPFTVQLENGGSVQVLGTQFNVKQEADRVSVVVRSGKVRFNPRQGLEGPVLTAEQKGEYAVNAGNVQVKHLQSLNELAWQTGGLVFVNTPLQQVVRDIEKYYGVTVKLNNEQMFNCPHSAPLTNQSVDQVLNALAITHQLKLKKTGQQSYELSGGKCR